MARKANTLPHRTSPKPAGITNSSFSAPGAVWRRASSLFTVWGPLLKELSVKVLSPEPLLIPMSRDVRGYWRAETDSLVPGSRYLFVLDRGKERPDPASRSQPEGVHGPSELVDPAAFRWTDGGWKGRSLEDFILYELHVGAFTREGTFEAAIGMLGHLKQLGITAVEIMPIAQFPGGRNWGYDGVYPYAPQNTYGGPDGFKLLVDACHRAGLAVVLDVVYNHLGPDGNYLRDFGPYFTPHYKTPWGDAVNFDGAYSDEVRTYFIENALYWVTEFHVDGLRLDAIDTMYDLGARHILQDLREAVHSRAHMLGRLVTVIAESDLNDTRIIDPPERGGYHIDAQWNDDFHHSLHALLTGERNGYYQDFGTVGHMAQAFQEGYVYSGQYSPFRKRRHGNSSHANPGHQFVVCAQNHDQVGNRMLGERTASLLSFEQLKVAAACVIFSPFIPLLFMGEEYGETAPFQYFVHHIDESLVQAVRRGRSMEFAHFEWEGEVPDPQAESTFLRSKIDPELRMSGPHRALFDYYRELLLLRRTLPALSRPDKHSSAALAVPDRNVLLVTREGGGTRALIVFGFADRPVSIQLPDMPGTWTKTIDSASPRWQGPGEAAPGTLGSDGSSLLVRLNGRNMVLYSLDSKEHS